MTTLPSTPADLNDLPLLRPGAVARSLGMSVETLRAWEHRYGITSSQHSGGGQRLYSQEDLQRLGWIKKLGDAGHRIGKLATLSPEDLQALVQSLGEDGGASTYAIPAGPGTHGLPEQPVSLRLALVGPWIASKAACDALGRHHVMVTSAVETLEALDAPTFDAELLLLESAVLEHDLVERLDSLQDAGIVAPVMILYRFGAKEMVTRLAQAGHRLVRKPMDGLDIGWLVDLLRRVELATAQPPGSHEESLPPPRFSDSELARISAASDRMLCECPRHLAELLTALTGFERYSRQCESDSAEEAELHHTLSLAAARARLSLEEALLRLAQVKGMTLP